MNLRNHRRQQGQSLPLMALLMVFLVAMTGLSVDVGHAFSQERQLQDSANAAALAGINTVVSNNGKPSTVKVTNGQVWDNIQRTLSGNRVDTAGGEYTYRADYVLANGTKQLIGQWNGSTSYLPDGGTGTPPPNIIRVQITSTQTVPTFFVRAVGREDFTVNVNGNACLGGYGLGVLGMGVPLNLKKTVLSGWSYVPYHKIYNADGSLLSTSDTSWGNWDQMKGRSIFLPIASNDNLDGSHVAWLSWKGATDNTTLAAAMTYPSTLQDGFSEGPEADPTLKNSKPLNRLTLGDWVSGKTGLPSTLATQLTQLKDAKQEIGLPIYDTAGKVSGTTSFHTVKIGLFRVQESTLTSSNSSIGSNYVKLVYLGDKGSTPTQCAGEPNTPITKKKFNIDGVSTVDAIWGTPTQTSSATYDFVLVMDTSGSMARDWNDIDRGASYARINDAKKVIRDFVRGYNVAVDPDARMSFVTFSGGGNGEPANQLARLVTPWTTSGCPEKTVITPTLCTDDMKWKSLQGSANSMTATGYTPGPVAFEVVETLLQNKRTPPAGKSYQQIVIFATDGVFNICGSVPPINPQILLNPCYYGRVPENNTSKLNDAGYMIMPGRPIWQAQEVAKRIKATSVPIFVIALTPKCTALDPNDCFSTKGLKEMSSGVGYYSEANSPTALAGIYERIAITVIETECKPGGDELIAPGTVIRLTQPGNPSVKLKVTADSNGKWSFKDLDEGQYIITADPIMFTSKDGKTRTYPELVNKLNPNEADQATIVINGQNPNGSSTPAAVKLTLEPDENGVYPSACPTP